jgi:hypothetical protein
MQADALDPKGKFLRLQAMHLGALKRTHGYGD